MRSVNKVIIIGNLTRDPEMRQTPNGQSVTTFGIATNREWMTKEGDHKSSAEFHECVAWARLAEICSSYIKKGSLVYVEGYLKTRSWDSQEGIKKFKTEIVVQDMIILEKKKHDGEEEYVPGSDDDMGNGFEEDLEQSGSQGRSEQGRSEAEAPIGEAEVAESTEDAPKEQGRSEAEAPKGEAEVAESTEDAPKEEPPAAPTTEAPTNDDNPIDKDLGL